MYITNNSYIIVDIPDLHKKDSNYLYLDENSEMGQIFLENFPYVEIEQIEGNVTSVRLLPKPLIDIEPLKLEKITQSKQELALYLQNNPLQFTDGKFYSVITEKQTLLANALQVYQMKIQAGLPATLKWNSTGEECTEWTLENLSMLALAIAEYVEPLVTHQQALEVQIRNCETLEELEAIEINYEVI
jgi:hypothetical protein